MIKYLGSKRLLLPRITETVAALPEVRSALDLFSGTSRVGHALKSMGLRVVANDHNAYAATLARCYVQSDRDEVLPRAERLLAELSSLPPRDGWFTETFCRRSRYLKPENGARVEAIREAIARMDLDPELEAVALTSLMEAADRVDSTTGVQMAFLKQWAPRASNPLTLRMPAVLPRATHGKGEAHQRDAAELAGAVEVDLAYLDPPYNQHKYLGNYHLWETLVRWDAPEVYGAACKRADCRERRSDFNSRRRAMSALTAVVSAVKARWMLVSFSDEGFVSREAMESLLAARGPVEVVAHPYRRYVGARIGIYNPAGERVGRVSHTENTEFLYRVGPMG
ncbi:MAG: DNA adenine methylase [Polyangiales bacterium]